MRQELEKELFVAELVWARGSWLGLAAGLAVAPVRHALIVFFEKAVGNHVWSSSWTAGYYWYVAEAPKTNTLPIPPNSIPEAWIVAKPVPM